MMSLDTAQIDSWAEAAQVAATAGRSNQRIAALAHCQPDWFAVQMQTPSGSVYRWGKSRTFTLMSVVKPLLLLYLLEAHGAEQIFQWVGTAPSEAPFYSLEQLIADGGHPRNPMLNSGAILLASRLPGRDGQGCCDALSQWLQQRSGCALELDQKVLAAVQRGRRDANRALVSYLAQTGQLQNPERALDAYERICCLAATVADLARLGGLLAWGNVPAPHRRIVNALMLTCGLYEDSAAYAVRVGLPMKSGISGALLTVLPGRGCVATYGPALDGRGNSVAGLAFVEQLAQGLQLSLFG